MRGRTLGFVVAALLVGGLSWLAWKDAEPAKTKQTSVSKADSEATPSKARRSLASPQRSPAPGGSEEGAYKDLNSLPATSTCTRGGTSLLDQLVAARAIESQMEVSRFLDRNAELAKAKIDRFCEEAEALPTPPFRRPKGLQDAASFMASRSDWTGPNPRRGSLHLPEALEGRLQGDRWLGVTEADLVGRDFGWMKDLSMFGTWDLSAQQAAQTPDSPVQLPNYLTLLGWAKLRMAHAMLHGDFFEASTDVRSLADLLYSQNVLLGELIAVKMLEIERQAYDRAKATERRIAEIPLEDLEQLRHLERVAPSFFMPGVDPEVMKRALECSPTPCTALVEAAWVEASIGEFSPQQTKDVFWPMVEERGCNMRLVERIRSAGGMSVEQARAMFASTPALQRWPR